MDVQVAFTPFPEIVDEMGTGEPILDLSKGDGPAALTTMGGAFEGFITTGDFIKENKVTVDSFIKAHIEAIEWMKDPANRQQMIELVNKHVAVSIIPEAKRPQIIERMIDNYSAFLGYTVDPKAIDGWNEYLAASGLADRAVTADEVIYAGAPKP